MNSFVRETGDALESATMGLMTEKRKRPYNVSTERSEGICSTDVEVRLIEPLQEADVIVTFCLQRRRKLYQFICSSQNKDE